MALIIITDAREKITDENIREIATTQGAKDMVPEGCKFLNSHLTTIDGATAAMIEYSRRIDRAGLVIDSYYVTTYFRVGTKLVAFQGSVGMAPTSPELLAARMQEFRPLFVLMAGSIVIVDKWQK
jgi:hypothetical protein